MATPTLLTDVARRAGVSLATASRAFGEPERLAPGTLERVLSAAAFLGYEAPQAARAVRTFGLVVPDIANPVFAALIKAIHSEAWHGRHRAVLFDSDEDLLREREQIGLARSLDGMILCSPRLPAEVILELTSATPIVVVNRVVTDATSVLMDAEIGLEQAIDHLVALGHRRIAYVRGPAKSWADQQRGAAIDRFCAARGIQPLMLNHHAATIQGGLASAATVVASGATAAITYNDLVALGLQSGAAALGRRCPEDLSIVGIDDLDIAAAAQPGLTSVKVAIEKSGSLSLELLLEHIAGSTTRRVVHLESELIARGSTGPVPIS